MKKYFKNLIILCLTVCFTACLALFATACQNEPETPSDEGKTYTVLVLNDEDAPVQNVVVQFCPVGKACAVKATDSNGKAVYDLTTSVMIGATEFDVHITGGIPEGYTSDYLTNETALRVNIADGYTCTIKLVKVEEQDPAPVTSETFAVSFASATEIVNHKPAIEVAGFYELRSASAFTYYFGEEKIENVSCVYSYVSPDDTLKLGSYGGESDYSFYIALKENTMTAEAPLAVSVGSAYIFELEAEETCYFINPAESGIYSSSGATISVKGSNFKAEAYETTYTDVFMVGSGKTFQAQTADGNDGTMILFIDSPRSSTTVTVGAESDIEIELISTNRKTEAGSYSDMLYWVSDTFNVLVELPEAGNYRITLTKTDEADGTKVNNIVSTGDTPVVPLFTEVNSDEWTFNITDANLQYVDDNVFRIELSANDFDFSSVENGAKYSNGDKVTYKILIEKIVTE